MPTHLDNEQFLVAAAQAGDSDAFVTLLNQYSRHIYRLGVSITGNHHDAEDVLQEASLKAYTEEPLCHASPEPGRQFARRSVAKKSSMKQRSDTGARITQQPAERGEACGNRYLG